MTWAPQQELDGVGQLWWTDLADAPELAAGVVGVEQQVPAFLAELTVDARARLTATDPAGTAVLVAPDAEVVAVVRSVRLAWDGARSRAPVAGAREALGRAGERNGTGVRRRDRHPAARPGPGGSTVDGGAAGNDTVAVLDVVVAEAWRGRGVGSAVLGQLDRWRAHRGADRLLVLLRPHAKQDYPLVPFARYASFTTPAGEPFDPWLRAAWRAGLVPVSGVDRSFIARAALDDWQRWLGRPVPGSGPYLVPGAIKPAILETERDGGGYREPHLWAAPVAALQRPRADAGEGAAGPEEVLMDASPSASARWIDALAAAGVVAGDRSHRQVRRRR